MAVIFAGPYTTGNMDQPQWEEVESKLWADGVINGARNSFAVTLTSGLGVSVNTGDAVVDSFRFYSDTPVALTATAADPTNPRIDRVILRVDGSAHTSTIVIKAGTPAPSPVPPALTQTVPAGTYELSLAQIRINAGAATIASLTDERVYTHPAIGPNAITSAQILSVLASAVAAGTLPAGVIEPAAQVGAGGLPASVGIGVDPATTGFPGPRVGVNVRGTSDASMESANVLWLIAQSNAVVLMVNAYHDGGIEKFIQAGVVAAAFTFAAGGQMSVKMSTNTPAAGAAITWGQLPAIPAAIFATTAPSATGLPVNTLWINTGL